MHIKRKRGNFKFGLMILALLAVLLSAWPAQPQRPADPPEVVELRARERSEVDQLDRLARGYLWPANDAEFREASARLKDPAFAGFRKNVVAITAPIPGSSGSPPLHPNADPPVSLAPLMVTVLARPHRRRVNDRTPLGCRL